MTLTYPVFYYGFEVTLENRFINFREGTGPNLVAELEVGSYTATELPQAIKVALDTAGENVYWASFNRFTRKIEISSNHTFSLLTKTGSHAASGIWTLLGFSRTADFAGASSYEGSSPAGFAFRPQFPLQGFVGPENYQRAVDATVSRSASGRNVEVIKFGTEKFCEFNITLATDVRQPPGTVLRDNPDGVGALRRFLQFATTKGAFEFMRDEADLGTYHTVILESTPESQNGVGYRLRELFDDNLPGYFETGTLTLRVLE